ncbi:MAG: cofactor-independent phosphoglycerate mutase [Pirellulaceae bacterium]
MKYAIIIPDGCADEPIPELDGRTPLQAADIPAMDEIARTGIVGRSNNTPAHLPAGSDVANLSLFGYDPNVYFTGRAPLEAAAQGIKLAAEDWAVRCNLVCVENGVMKSFTAGHISSPEAAELLKSAQKHLGADNLEFVPGVSYRNLLLYRGAKVDAPFSRETMTTPPHDITDQPVAGHHPSGPGSDLLNTLMGFSQPLFASHPVNVTRQQAGKLPASQIWLWGLGKTPSLTPFFELHGKHGKMITAVDLLRGLAALIGWDRIEVPGATGYTDTDYAAKGRYAVEALKTTDIICVHVEATDEASHEGDFRKKIEALQQIDRHIVAPLHAALKTYGDYRILVSPDHPTTCRIKTHAHGHVPFAICGSGVKPAGTATYDEVTAAKSELCFDRGWELMSYFLKLS